MTIITNIQYALLNVHALSVKYALFRVKYALFLVEIGRLIELVDFALVTL